MLFISIVSLAFPFSIPAFAVAVGYLVWLMIGGFPIGWGVAFMLFSLFYMVGAYRQMNAFTRQGGVRDNSGAAACLVMLLAVLFVFSFITSSLPYELSSWWALLLPFVLVLHLLLQGAFEPLLYVIHPAGRR